MTHFYCFRSAAVPLTLVSLIALSLAAGGCQPSGASAASSPAEGTLETPKGSADPSASKGNRGGDEGSTASREDPSGGSPSGGNQPPPAPGDANLTGIALTPGLRESEFVDAHGKRQPLAVAIPEGIDQKPRPLVVFLHGASGSSGLPGLECLVQPAFDKLRPIAIAPHVRGGQWWKSEPAALVASLVKAARAQWPVNPKRVVLMGYSNGGIGTWALAQRFPELFSAAIPMASSEGVIGETSVPVYAISGENDELFDVPGVQAAVKRLKAEGHDVQIHVKPAGSHFRMCSYVPELELAGEWLERDVWSAAR